MRDFARATGQLAKTDLRGAAVLALLAERLQPGVRRLPDAEQQALAARVARRRQLTEMIVAEMIVAERNRLRTADPAIRPGIEAHVAFLEAQRREAEHAVAETAEGRALGCERDDVLQSAQSFRCQE